MRIPEWLRLFRKHPEKHLFSTGDLLQLTEQRKDVLLVELTRLVKSGTIERTARGWYSNPFYPPTPEEIAMVLRHPSYISMEYALSFHSVLSQSTYTITLITTRQPYIYRRGKSVFEYHQITRGLFWGFEKMDDFYMAKPEKALLDLIYIRLVRNREFSPHGLMSLIDDMYLENMNKDRLEKYANIFGGKTLKIVGETLRRENL
ncbi:MAG: hypothetical protein KKE04_00560 [Candidatus Thermoplasmatota archaeon]|nr:hypothetical protein [Candidatus Thermoplasmatota archaeon]